MPPKPSPVPWPTRIALCSRLCHVSLIVPCHWVVFSTGLFFSGSLVPYSIHPGFLFFSFPFTFKFPVAPGTAFYTLLISTKAASRGSISSSMTVTGLQKKKKKILFTEEIIISCHSKPLFVDSVCSGVSFPRDFIRVQRFFFNFNFETLLDFQNKWLNSYTLISPQRSAPHNYSTRI